MKNLLTFLTVLFSSIAFGQVNYQYFSKAEVVSDLDYLAEKINSIHPMMLDQKKSSWWKNQVAELKSNLPDSLTKNDSYLLFSRLIAKMQDGHTGLQIPFDQRKVYLKAGGLSFPFIVKIEDGSLFVDFYCGKDSTLFEGGEEILQINGVDVEDMLDKMEKLLGVGSSHIRKNQVAHYFRFLTWIVYGWEDNYDMLITDSTYPIKRVQVKGVSSTVFIESLKKRSVQENRKFNLSVDESKSIALMQIKTFGDLDKFCSFADSSFSLITNKNIRNLIIDVRENGGGRSVVVDSLMNYLTDQSYAHYQLIETRISSDLLEYYKTKYPETYEQLKNTQIDSLQLLPVQIKLPPPKNNRFKGNLFVLTDKGTYSAAATFAGVIKEWGMGILIGEETGGTIEYYGDYWMHQTPIMNLSFYISPKKFTQFGGAHVTRGVKPDYELNDKSDMILKFTYDLISNI